MGELWEEFRHILRTFAAIGRRSPARRYAFALIISLLVFPLFSRLNANYFQVFNDQALFTLVFIMTVTASAVYGGLGPGIVTTTVAILLNYKWFPKELIFLHFGVYFLIGGSISLMAQARYEVDKQKDQFIAFMAHEIKNPLSAIIGFSELILKKSNGNHSDKIIDYTQSITRSSYRILELVEDLLDLTKIEIGRLTYNDQVFKVGELIKEVVSHQQVINKDRIIELKSNSKRMFFGDPYRIGQVLTNLISNAIKYSPEDKKITVKLKETKENICLCVKDRGIGIPKTEQVRIFNLFYRIGKNGTSQGLGLGLYICEQIIDHYNGKIWIESKKGLGSTFFIEIPFLNLKNNKDIH